MGNIDAVPAGKYGKAALERLGIWDDVKPQIAPVDNVIDGCACQLRRTGVGSRSANEYQFAREHAFAAWRDATGAALV